ncbi:MAG: hypothetical protein DRP50_07760 [Thermotoga sp.]|nr:MAG: hypothetical protein DRP50_07760 [Thermotoga sp.]
MYVYGEGYDDQWGESHYIEVNGDSNQRIYFDPVQKFGSMFSWRYFDINVNWLTSGSNTFYIYEPVRNEGWKNSDLQIGIDTENDFDRSQWKRNNWGSMPPPEQCDGELMIYLEITIGGGIEMVIRDDDNEMNDNVNVDYSDDYAIKYLYIASNVLDKITSAKLYVYGMGHNDQIGSTHYLEVNDNSNQRIYFDPILKFGGTYRWEMFDIDTDWLLPGQNKFEIRESWRQEGWKSSDLKVGIDTYMDYGRSDIKQNTNYKDGELMMYLLITTTGDPDGDAFEYSGTYIEEYINLPDLSDLHLNWQKVQYWLGNIAGWQESFLETEGSVGEEDFRPGSGTDSEDADFHYHVGHGVDDIGTELAMRGWIPMIDYEDVRVDDVWQKWGDEDNEWMFLQSCHILSDSDWVNALDDGHMIIGFVDEGTTSTWLLEYFFTKSINSGWTVREAWYYASTHTYSDGRRVGIFADSLSQLNYDHLWGQGCTVVDEYPDDGYVFIDIWECN